MTNIKQTPFYSTTRASRHWEPVSAFSRVVGSRGFFIDMKKRGYIHRITLAATKNEHLFPKGEITQPRIAHDNWCKINKGKSCNCYPDITIQTPNGLFFVDHAGNCHSCQ